MGAAGGAVPGAAGDVAPRRRSVLAVNAGSADRQISFMQPLFRSYGAIT
jgi:hypothetical protein